MNMSPYWSSYLFLVPAFFSFILLPCKDVSYACIICAITSVNNHFYKCQDRGRQKIDQVIVRSVAGMYTLHALCTMQFRPFAIPMYFFGILSSITYIYTHKIRSGYNYHYLIHIFSNLGIMFYVFARHTYLSY